jgi:hypothetical protein
MTGRPRVSLESISKFGVPSELIMAIQECYSRAQSVISVNKFTSAPLMIGSGVRQGDPRFCLLFNVVIETHVFGGQRSWRMRAYACEYGMSFSLQKWQDEQDRSSKSTFQAFVSLARPVTCVFSHLNKTCKKTTRKG